MDPKLIPAIIQVESGGDDEAIGDKTLRHKAYGPMQIRQPVCDDVNRVYGTRLAATDMLGNRALSIDTFGKYVAIYCTEKRLGRPPVDEDYAKTWNAGPAGPFGHAADLYWMRVQAAMAAAGT